MNKSNYSDTVTKLATVPQAVERYKLSRNTLMQIAENAIHYGFVREELIVMSVPVFEQETTVNFSRDMETATVWTSDKTVMTKFDKLCAKNPSDYRCVEIGKAKSDGELLSKTYEMSKRLLSFRACKQVFQG